MHVQGVNGGQALACLSGTRGARQAEAAMATDSTAGQQLPPNAAGAAHPAHPPGIVTARLSSESFGAVLSGQENGASHGISQGNGAALGRQALELAMSQAVQSYLQPGHVQARLGVTA